MRVPINGEVGDDSRMFRTYYVCLANHSWRRFEASSGWTYRSEEALFRTVESIKVRIEFDDFDLCRCSLFFLSVQRM